MKNKPDPEAVEAIKHHRAQLAAAQRALSEEAAAIATATAEALETTSQRALAAALGVSAWTVADWARNGRGKRRRR